MWGKEIERGGERRGMEGEIDVVMTLLSATHAAVLVSGKAETPL